MRRYQGFEVEDYVFTLDALPLKPSRFCNIRVYYRRTYIIWVLNMSNW
jgi:hypothetical protein